MVIVLLLGIMLFMYEIKQQNNINNYNCYLDTGKALKELVKEWENDRKV